MPPLYQGGVERGGRAALTAFVMLALKDVASSDQLAGGFACLEDGLVMPNKTLYSEVGCRRTVVGSMLARCNVLRV